MNLLALADLYDTSVDELLGREGTSVEKAYDEETVTETLAAFPPIATRHAVPVSRSLSARLPRPLLFSAAWLAIVMIAAVGMSLGYAAHTWLPVIPLYCWMLRSEERRVGKECRL